MTVMAVLEHITLQPWFISIRKIESKLLMVTLPHKAMSNQQMVSLQSKTSLFRHSYPVLNCRFKISGSASVLSQSQVYAKKYKSLFEVMTKKEDTQNTNLNSPFALKVDKEALMQADCWEQPILNSVLTRRVRPYA